MPATQATRPTRSGEKTRATYDRLSKYYDLLTGFGESDLTESALQALGIETGEQVLEIGFGTGRGLLALAHMVGESGLVHGIDISGGMLQVARRRVRDAPLGKRIVLSQGDARDLPYGQGEFDAVFLSFTLELFPASDIPIVLRECRRVLREHGRLGIVSLSSDEKLGLVGRLYQWLHTKFPTYLDCRPIPVEQTLENAGFEQVRTEARSLWGLPVAIAVAQVCERPWEQS